MNKTKLNKLKGIKQLELKLQNNQPEEQMVVVNTVEEDKKEKEL